MKTVNLSRFLCIVSFVVEALSPLAMWKLKRVNYMTAASIMCSCSAFANLVNITIDDQFGDAVTGAIPGYLPTPGNWSIGQNCPGCFAQPDASLAFRGTWHDTTWDSDGYRGAKRTLNLTFSGECIYIAMICSTCNVRLSIGSAIYVFFILANSIPNTTTITNLSIVFDDGNPEYYTHTPSNSTDYQYNQLVYSNSQLSDSGGQHELLMSTIGINGSLILFDYAIRT